MADVNIGKKDHPLAIGDEPCSECGGTDFVLNSSGFKVCRTCGLEQNTIVINENSNPFYWEKPLEKSNRLIHNTISNKKGDLGSGIPRSNKMYMNKLSKINWVQNLQFKSKSEERTDKKNMIHLQIMCDNLKIENKTKTLAFEYLKKIADHEEIGGLSRKTNKKINYIFVAVALIKAFEYYNIDSKSLRKKIIKYIKNEVNPPFSNISGHINKKIRIINDHNLFQDERDIDTIISFYLDKYKIRLYRDQISDLVKRIRFGDDGTEKISYFIEWLVISSSILVYKFYNEDVKQISFASQTPRRYLKKIKVEEGLSFDFDHVPDRYEDIFNKNRLNDMVKWKDFISKLDDKEKELITEIVNYGSIKLDYLEMKCRLTNINSDNLFSCPFLSRSIDKLCIDNQVKDEILSIIDETEITKRIKKETNKEIKIEDGRSIIYMGKRDSVNVWSSSKNNDGVYVERIPKDKLVRIIEEIVKKKEFNESFSINELYEKIINDDRNKYTEEKGRAISFLDDATVRSMSDIVLASEIFSRWVIAMEFAISKLKKNTVKNVQLYRVNRGWFDIEKIFFFDSMGKKYICQSLFGKVDKKLYGEVGRGIDKLVEIGLITVESWHQKFTDLGYEVFSNLFSSKCIYLWKKYKDVIKKAIDSYYNIRKVKDDYAHAGMVSESIDISNKIDKLLEFNCIGKNQLYIALRVLNEIQPDCVVTDSKEYLVKNITMEEVNDFLNNIEEAPAS